MKFLIIAGTPSFHVPNIGLSYSLDERFSSVNPFEVIDKLLSAEHEVTMLTLDSVHIHDDAFSQRVKVLSSPTYDELCTKLRYLAKHVQYDCIVSLLKMPYVQGVRQFTSNIPFDEDNEEFALEEVRVSEQMYENDVWLSFSNPKDETTESTDVIHTLDASGASIVCLEHISPNMTDEMYHELSANRMISIRNGKPTVVIIDPCFEDIKKRGVFIMGKNGGNFVQEMRVLEFMLAGITEAAQIAAELHATLALPVSTSVEV